MVEIIRKIILRKRLIRNYFLLLLLAALLCPAPGATAEKLSLPLLWTSNLKTLLESAPTVADINNDRRDEVVIAGREELIALQKNGREMWRWHTRGRFMTYPAVLPRKGKAALIFAADNSGLLSCLDGAGKVVWQADLNGPAEWSASVVSDLNNDGRFEVVQTDAAGTVWVFDALTGKVVQQTKVSGKPVSPAVGNLDDDGISEIVVAENDGSVTAVSSDGAILWKYKIGGFSETWSTSAPVIFAASDGRGYVAAASSDGKLFCLNSAGQPVWVHPTRGAVASAISVGDFDQDGRADIFLITQIGVVYRFLETGTLLWKFDMQGRSLAPGAIIDLDNDRNLEYVFCTQRGHLMALNQDCQVVFDHQLDTRTINVTPAFGDVTRNSKNMEMIITGGESGKTFCFGTPALRTSLSQWPAYRTTPRNTGAWFGLTQSDSLRMIPQNLAWNLLLTGKPVQFTIYNPTPGKMPLKATATCITPDNARQTALSSILGTQGRLLFPVSFDQPGTYRFNWELKNSDGQILLKNKKQVTVRPFGNDRALAEKAISTLTAAAGQVEKKLPLSAKALQEESLRLQKMRDNLLPLQEELPENSAENAQTALKQTANLNRQSKRALKISKTVQEASLQGKRTGFIVFEGKKWENRGVDQQLPSHPANPLKISHSVVPGEHQPIPLVLFNITSHILNVRLEIDSLQKGFTVTPLHPVATITSLGEESWDALPEMDESGVIAIPPLRSREIWLDVKIDSVSPGIHHISLRLQALNGAGVMDAPPSPHAVPSPEAKVEIILDVLPFSMAPAGDFRLCTWSPSEGPEVADLLAHGNNVFIVPYPLPQYDAHNKLTGLNFSGLDSIVRQFEGWDVFLLISGFPALKAEFGAADYQQKLTSFLDKLVPHLQLLGIDSNHFALYPLDEPGGHGWETVNRLVSFGKMVHSAHPEAKLYMDGGGELQMFKAMASCVDVWVPPSDWLSENIPEMEVMRNNGTFLWSYNCSYSSARPIGPNIKNINLINEFRTAALFAFLNHATGIGFWCYNAGRENPWMRIKLEYNLVYPGRNGPVTSRRWEAIRESIEDYRILAALQEFSEQKNQEKYSETVEKKIEHLLNISLPNLVDNGFQAVKLGLSGTVIDDVSSEAKMAAFRQEMIDCVKATVNSPQTGK